MTNRAIIVAIIRLCTLAFALPCCNLYYFTSNNNKKLKTPFVKTIIFGTVFLCAAKCALASVPYDFSDTSRKMLQAAINKNDDTYITLKESNVVFPEILTGNESNSLDYVEKFSASRREYLIRTFNRSKKYFPKAASILEKHDVPQEFKVLLALESGFNAEARSKAGAIGYWQIMDDVAKEYGLRIAAVNKKTTKKGDKKHQVKKVSVADDRKNFNKSTYAASRYLKDRSRNLNNDWLLMAASYNCGVGNVWEAMKRTGKASPTFWDIKNYLPAETRAYVMNFIALNVIFYNYEKFVANELLFKPIQVKADCNSGEAVTGATVFIE